MQSPHIPFLCTLLQNTLVVSAWDRKGFCGSQSAAIPVRHSTVRRGLQGHTDGPKEG